MKRVIVSANGTDRYPAWINPDETHTDGWVKPHFDVDTVRELAANTKGAAEEYGHDWFDTVHVFDGGEDEWGLPLVVVTVVDWSTAATSETGDIADAVTIVDPIRHIDDTPAGGDDGASEPDPDYPGVPLYPVGGHDWCWFPYAADGIHPDLPAQRTK